MTDEQTQTRADAPPANGATPVNQLLGIGLRVGATVALIAMLTSVKLVSARYPTGEILFFRSAIACVLVLAWLSFTTPFWKVFETTNLAGHGLRSLAGIVGVYLNFLAVALLPIADATAIGYITPILTVVFAIVMLRERVHAYRLAAVAIGFVGILIIMSNYVGTSAHAEPHNLPGALVAVCGATFAALAATQTRRLSRSERGTTITAYFLVFSGLAGALTLPFGWAAPTWPDFWVLALCGLSGGVSQILTTYSYKYGDASTLAPFDYLTMVWTLVVGALVFNTWPSLAILAGTAVVIGASVFVVWYEHRRRRLAAQAP